ncbi:hypothetical protein SEA_LUNA18_49 [Microbacterium phage Luna18]|nr:hypothetical protein SEA_CHEPLI_49 [Microbacterium phage Chepli]QZE10336.1 hypothetical protein SEA_KATCHAN_48 [Microbacterium phage KatChan]URQ04899.1 hypothetical protein SEA_LUNA18_49 [Microbacterium phage Luna18]
MWYENLFGAFWILLQGILWIGAIIVAALVVGAVITGVWKKLMEKEEPARQVLLNNAEARAISMYRDERDPQLLVNTYTRGADYMWEALHPKPERKRKR